MKQTLAFSILIILSGYMCVNAQDLVITGKVTDSNGSALPWTSVSKKGDNTYRTKSDKDGEYILNIKSTGNDTLDFSHIGYEKKEVALNDQQTVDIILTESNIDPSEVVVIAYNVKKEEVLPVEIPNAYKWNNSIEIPNAYNPDKDNSIEMPNTRLVNPNPKTKTTPIPKITPKFLPNPVK